MPQASSDTSSLRAGRRIGRDDRHPDVESQEGAQTLWTRRGHQHCQELTTAIATARLQTTPTSTYVLAVPKE